MISTSAKVRDRMKSFLNMSSKSSSSSPTEAINNSDREAKVDLPQKYEQDDEMFIRLRREAAAVVQKEPILCMLLTKVGLLDASTVSKLSTQGSSGGLSPSLILNKALIQPAKSFEEIISRIVSHRLSSCQGGSENICPKFLCHLLEESFNHAEDELELGHSMSYAVREDAMAILRRDPACETLLEAVLFMKGFHSLVIHRAARRAWKPVVENNQNGGDIEQAKSNSHDDISVTGKRFVALLLQSQASSAFGVDIHPACSIGAGVMFDHASGIVIGETAVIGDGTTILHGVTLGGTGKDHGDRHPKIGKDVLIGAGTKILGNITVGDRCKIGAGSVVLRPIPGGATAVGAPAKIIGFTKRGEKPGSSVDISLDSVEPLVLGKKVSSASTETTMDSTVSNDVSKDSAVTQKEKKLAQGGNVKGGTEGDTEESTSNEEEEDKSSVEKEASDEDEEDDNVTDFGTQPKCRWVEIPSQNDRLCPFSGSFRDISSSIRQSTISHKELRALLIQEGCSEGECVEVFFELLHCTPSSSKERECGCIPLDIFQRCFPEIAKEKTKLDDNTIQALAKGDLRALGMSKKASKRFKSVFTQLGARCPPLPRIPSSSSLLSEKSPLRKSEREKMESHLDTIDYREGIAI